MVYPCIPHVGEYIAYVQYTTQSKKTITQYSLHASSHYGVLRYWVFICCVTISLLLRKGTTPSKRIIVHFIEL
jgi:hypothetical protein